MDTKKFRFKDHNHGLFKLCKYCKVSETVEHYLMDCSGQGNKLALEMNSMDANDACNVTRY